MPVWTGGKSRPHRDSIPERPARSQSLYRLSYPAHLITFKEAENEFKLQYVMKPWPARMLMVQWIITGRICFVAKWCSGSLHDQCCTRLSVSFSSVKIFNYSLDQNFGNRTQFSFVFGELSLFELINLEMSKSKVVQVTLIAPCCWCPSSGVRTDSIGMKWEGRSLERPKLQGSWSGSYRYNNCNSCCVRRGHWGVALPCWMIISASFCRHYSPVRTFASLTVWRLTTHIWVVPHR